LLDSEWNLFCKITKRHNKTTRSPNNEWQEADNFLHPHNREHFTKPFEKPLNSLGADSRVASNNIKTVLGGSIDDDILQRRNNADPNKHDARQIANKNPDECSTGNERSGQQHRLHNSGLLLVPRFAKYYSPAAQYRKQLKYQN
jgi:hypothetical protein